MSSSQGVVESKMLQNILDALTGLTKDMGKLEENVGKKMGELKEDVGGLKKDMGELKEDVGGLKEDVGGLKKDVGGLKKDVGGLKKEMGELEENVGNKMGELEENMLKGLKGLKNDICVVQLGQQGGQVVRKELQLHNIDPYDLVVDGKVDPQSHLPVLGTFSFGLMSDLSAAETEKLTEIAPEVVAYYTKVRGVLSLTDSSGLLECKGFPVVVGSAHTVFSPHWNSATHAKSERVPIAVPPSLADRVKAILVANTLLTTVREKTCIGEELFCFVLDKFPDGQKFVYDLGALCSTPNASPEGTSVSLASAERGAELVNDPVGSRAGLTNEASTAEVAGAGSSAKSAPGTPAAQIHSSSSTSSPAAHDPAGGSGGTQHNQRVQFTAGLSNSIDPSGERVMGVERKLKGCYDMFVSHRCETGNSGTLMLGIDAAGVIQGIVGAFYGVSVSVSDQRRGLISPFLKDRSRYTALLIQPSKCDITLKGGIAFETSNSISTFYPSEAAKKKAGGFGSLWNVAVLWTDDD